MTPPKQEIRASYTTNTVRVYQAYSDQIAESALKNQTFVCPPFKLDRMTWIKPSFLWMMYRSGWGKKDDGQSRILGIDIKHEGFAWALSHSCPSHVPDGMSKADWMQLKNDNPVRIQWDPERDLSLNPLEHRTIQIGLSGEAVMRYADNWIVKITDLTELANSIHELVQREKLEDAVALLPFEAPYKPTGN